MQALELQLPYKPMVKQELAHQLSAKYRGFCGGWGNGKTSWGCVETFASLHEFPGTRWIIARKTRPELKSTTWDMFINGDPTQPHGWHGIPQETIKSFNKSDLVLEFLNGSIVYGLPLDDPRKLENFNLGGFWIDQAEEVEEDIFLRFHGRLRQRGAPREGLLSFNPNGHNWLWKRFFDPNRPGLWKKSYKAVEATTFDNPNLPEDYFEQFAGLPDVWLQRFVHGSHEVFIGQIFTDYNSEVHVIQPFAIPSNWERWRCIDPGIRHEGCVSWLARDPHGNCFYYREVLEANQPVGWWAAKIFEEEAKSDYGGPNEKIFRTLIGPEAQQRSQTDGRTVLWHFHKYGIYPEPADKDPSARISAITEYLRPLPGHPHPWRGGDAAPRLYIFSTCDKLQEYIPQYRWRPQRTNFAEEDAPEKPRKKDDHNIDCLGHILLALDGLPPVDSVNRDMDPETRFADAHFAAACAAAESRGVFTGDLSEEDFEGFQWEEELKAYAV